MKNLLLIVSALIILFTSACVAAIPAVMIAGSASLNLVDQTAISPSSSPVAAPQASAIPRTQTPVHISGSNPIIHMSGKISQVHISGSTPKHISGNRLH